MGSMASPVLGATPMGTVRELWGGELPAFESSDEMEALLKGLCNGLSAHLMALSSFKLLPVEVAHTAQGAQELALVRRQELDGFLDGLFGFEEQLDLPLCAREALGVLLEIRAMVAGAIDYLEYSTQCTLGEDLHVLIRNIQALTLTAEREMNNILQPIFLFWSQNN